MGMYHLDLIKARLRRYATVTPAETLVLLKEFDLRLMELENARTENPRPEKAKPGRPRSGGLSKKEVPAD